MYEFILAHKGRIVTMGVTVTRTELTMRLKCLTMGSVCEDQNREFFRSIS